VGGLLFGIVNTLLHLLFWLILIRAVLSWVVPFARSPFLYDLMRALEVLTEPVLAPIRRRMPPQRLGIDFSPLVAVVLIELVRQLLARVLLGGGL
jgi:YggT family protein